MGKFIKEDNMYYSIYDNQLGCIRSFSLNSKNAIDVKSALINYLLTGNFSDEGENSIKSNSLEELCNYYEFSLIESTEPISENFEL